MYKNANGKTKVINKKRNRKFEKKLRTLSPQTFVS